MALMLRQFFWLSLCLIVSIAVGHGHQSASDPVGEAAQFCAKDDVWGIDICAALGVSSTDATTIHLAFSGHFQDRKGWAAVGPGTAMGDALMFVFYPSNQAEPDSAHNPPKLDDRMKGLDIVYNNISDAGYFEATIMCSQCLDAQISQTQQWIWSFNALQEVRSSDIGKTLSLHTHYDKFRVQSFPGKILPVADASILRVNSDRHPHNIIKDDMTSDYKIDLMVFHGILMTLAFFAIFPGAGLLFMFRMNQAFSIHACAQLVGTGSMTSAIIIGIRHIVQTHSLSEAISEPHIPVGLALAALVPLQGALGWFHHLSYLKTGRTTILATIHKSLGKSVIILGMINVALGITISGSFPEGQVWLAFILGVGLWVVLYVLAKQARRRQDGEKSEIKYVVVHQAE